MRGYLRVLAAAVVLGSVAMIPRPAGAAPEEPNTAVWTASSYENVFKDDVPAANADRAISLVVARNEFEAAQVMIRKDQEFTVSGVDLPDLTGPAGTIPAANLSYHFLDYVHLNHNSVFGGNQPVDNVVHQAPGDFPDALSNDRTRTVPANTTQPIWIRSYIPKQTAPGTYEGAVTVHTDSGDYQVPISLQVENVTIPDAVDSSFTTALWTTNLGPMSWDVGKGDTIKLFYGWDRYSPQWWQLMGHFAQAMKDYRNNDLPLPVVSLLLDGGSSVDADGTYHFDWSRFDQVVDFFTQHGAVKRLEGFWMSGDAFGKSAWQTELIGRDDDGKPIREYAQSDSEQVAGWVDQFVPALKAHIEANGWAGKWWMHVGDEPSNDRHIASYKAMAGKIRAHWPDVRLGDAIFDQNSATQLDPVEDILIPNELAIGPNPDYYEQQRQAGKELWMYNCNIPIGTYLNRFIDQPVWDQRATMWYSFEHGITGYLHWAMNNWQYAIDDQDVKGDGYIVEPDKANNTIKPTIRYESLRDGLEDRELLQIVAQKDPGLAGGIAHSLVTDANRYSRDTAYMRRIRDILVSAAAGNADFDAQLAQATTGKVDLGAQSHVDAVKVRWKTGGTRTFAVQTSYDGTRWGTAATVEKATGPDAFVGVDAKARYVRVQVSDGPKDISVIRVAGAALDSPDLAGGKKYTKSVKPDHPDARNATSTDGILAGDASDNRSWGIDVAPGQTATVSATVDLGSTQSIGRIDIHRYQDYETRYSPDSVQVATSVDGKTFIDKGRSERPNGPDGLWYDFTFPSTDARYIQVTFTKTGADQADALFIDEIEAYAPPAGQGVNFAQGLKYVKSAEPDDPTYPDSRGAESTDGVIAGPSSDGHGYAYYLDSGQTRTISITIDLQGPKTISSAQLAKYDDGVHSYAPDKVAVYTRNDGEDFVERGSATWATGSWFSVDFAPVSASYVRFDITKTQGHFADYLFLDELAVYGDPATSTTNVALHRPYTKSDGGDPSYTDTDGTDSTDGYIAGHYSDHKSYAYLLDDGETRTVDITVDLGQSRDLQLVRFWRYNDGQHGYAPDQIVVSTSADGTNFTPQQTVTEPDDRWFIAPLKDVTARYVRISATKTYGYFAEYIFVDEIQVFGR